jgi:hypothetical protein
VTSAPVWERAARAAASLAPAAMSSPRGRHQAAPVPDAFQIEQNRPRLRVIDQRLEHLLGFDICLVAERDETREPKSLALEQETKLDAEVAALRDQPDGARRRHRAGEEQLRPGVTDAHAVRPQQPPPGRPHLRHDPRLAFAAGIAQLSKAGRDRHQHPAPDRQRVVDCGLE